MSSISDFTHDGFVSYSWTPIEIKHRVTKLVDKMREDHDIKLWQDRNEVGHGGVFDQMGQGIEKSEFFLPVITEDYVKKVDGNRIDLKNGKVTENCRFEVTLGMIHRGEPRSIAIVMDAKMEDRILGGTLGDLLHVKCFSDDDVEEAAKDLASLMQGAKDKKPALKSYSLPVFQLINKKTVQLELKRKAKEYVEGTRLWIYEHMQNKWLNQNNWNQVFVLLGYAGVGKSVCLANVCERGHLFEPSLVYGMLSKKESSRLSLNRLSQSIAKRISWKTNIQFIVVACHFFKHDDTRLSGAKDCIVSLAAQMCETVPYFLEYCSKNNKYTDVKGIDVKQLFNCLIAEPLQLMEDEKVSPSRGTRAFVVLDALDECRVEDREGLLDILQTTWWVSVPKWLGVCVSSRPEDYIPRILRDYKPTILDTENEANMNDMRVYLKHKLGKYFVENENDLKASVDIVLERSQGHFLYARFIESELSRVEKLTLKDVQGAKLFPAKLDGYYKEYFQRLFDKVGEAKYQNLLASMCVAREPLPVDVVGKLLDLEDEDVQNLFDEVSQLLVVNNRTVRFVHKSMADFLTDREKCTDKKLRIKEKDGKSAMAKYCRENYFDDIFAAKHLVYHLQGGDGKVVSELLCDFQKLHQVLAVLGVNHRSFVSDLNQYYRSTNKNAQLVVRALEKSLNGLDNDPRELASQLLGRIGDRNHPVLKTLEVDYSYIQAVNACLTNAEDSLRMTLNGHGGGVVGVAMNDEVIVSGSRNNTIKIWSRATGECLKTLEGHSWEVNSVAICDDVIVSGSDDCTVKVWSLKSGECLKTLEGHSGHVNSVAICDDVIVSGSDDCTVKVWSLKSGECLKTLEGHSSSVNSVAICDDVIVSGSYDNTVKVWSLKHGECLKTLEGHSESVNSVAICDDVIVSGSDDCTVKVWSLKSGECLKTLEGHSSLVYSVAICDGMIMSGSLDDTVKVWSLKSGECLKTLEGHSGRVNSVAICDDVIVSGSYDNTVKVWSLKSGECLKTLEGHSSLVYSVAICDDMIVSGSFDNTVKVWNMTSGVCLKTLHKHSDGVVAVAVRDEVIVSGSFDQTLNVWNSKTGQHLATLKGHSDGVMAVDICDDGIVSGSADQTVKIWSLDEWECLRTLRGHNDRVCAVAVCDDEVVSASYDNLVKIWSFKSGECLKSLEGHGHSNLITVLSIFDYIIVSKSLNETVRWSRTSFEKLNDSERSKAGLASPAALWVVQGNRVRHANVDIGFTMDRTNNQWEASDNRIACFDSRNVLNVLEIIEK